MTNHDIAVIGLGPAGCAATFMFAEMGLKVAVIEREEQVYQLPRAVNLDGEIIRGFQRFGRGEEINALMQQMRPGDRAGFANGKREWLFGQDMVPFSANGWQPINMFDQPEVEQHIRDLALAHPNVTAHIGCSATGIENTSDGVHIAAQKNNTDETLTVDARFAVGCDGASSFVRKQLDINWRDLGYDHDWLVVDVMVKPGHTLNNDTVQVCNPDRIVTYVCTKDPYRRWEFKLNEGETWDEMMKDEMIASLIDPWTPRGTYDIRRAAVYQFHAATADTWRIGNIFIAGDAAHQTPPFLGQGLNAGMRDIINLSWKFPLVLSGKAGDALLDTYYAEREAHAHDLVDWAVSIGQLMDHMADAERAQRAGEDPPPAPEKLQSSAYGQGREQPPIRAGAIYLPQVSDTGSTGYLFNQPIVKDASGKEFRLDEALGCGFAVVGKTQEALRLSDASQKVLDHLGATQVNLEGLEATRGRFDDLFRENDAAIVRPDRIVFGHTSSDMTLDALVSDLSEKLSLVV